MTRKPKAGDIGQGMHASEYRQIRTRRVQAGGGGNHLRIALRRQSLFLQGRRQNAHTQGLAQNQDIACLG